MNTQRDADWTLSLMEACLLGQLHLVRQLLDGDKENVNQGDEAGWTAMHFASAAGHADIVRLLLSRGADVNSTTHLNESCLLLAVRSGYTDTVRELVSAGADVNIQSNDDVSPLHVISHRKFCDVVKTMLDRIAQKINYSGTWLLLQQQQHFEFQHADGAEKDNSVLTHGCEIFVNLTNAYMFAKTDDNSQNNDDTDQPNVQLNERELIVTQKEFLEHSPVHIQGNLYGAIAVFCAFLLRYGNVFLKCLITTNEHVSSETSKYFYLLENGRFTRRRTFSVSLSPEACVYIDGFDDCSPLHEASAKEFTDINVAKLLLDNNANIETKDIKGFTPLLSAAYHGCADVVQLLFDRGADVNAVSNIKESCLLRAAKKGHANVVQLLISAGADVNLQCIGGRSALYVAAVTDVVKVLLENDNQHRVNVDAAEDFGGNRPLHKAVLCEQLNVVQLLVQHGAKLNVQNNDGETPLHIAVKRRYSDIIMFLLSQDADVGLTDVWRNTPFHYVTCELLKLSGIADCVKKCLSNESSDLIIRNAMGVTAKEHNIAHGLLYYQSDDVEYYDNDEQNMYVDCYGNTPLHHAVGVYPTVTQFSSCNDVSKVVEFLVDHGADINARNNAGHTPLHVAYDYLAVKTCLRYADDRSFTITDKQGRNFWHLVFFTLKAEQKNIQTAKSVSDSNTDSLRRTPLHYACMRDLDGSYVKDFISRFDAKHINNQDIFGRTAMHYAAIAGNQKLMDLLKTKKANGKIQDEFGRTAREYLAMRHTLTSAISRSVTSTDQFVYSLSIAVSIKQCLAKRFSDSAQCEAELRKIIHDARKSVDATTYVQNIYRKCGFNYSEQFVGISEPMTSATVTSAVRRKITFAAIHSHVTKAMKYLANKISSEDDRFACKVFPVGSAHEKTKIGCCDEFDYTFVLTKLSSKCRDAYSPESPPGFILVKVSTTDYDKCLFNDNEILDMRIVKFKFESLAKYVLSTSQFCETTGFEFDPNTDALIFSLQNTNMLVKPHINVELSFIEPVNGYHIMHRVSVDIVPALQINDWWPEDARRQDLCRTGECLIVFTQPQNKYPWVSWTEPHGFISFARAESRLMRECPQIVKAAYMVVKWMANHLHRFTLLLSSHVIKTALLWCLDDVRFRNCSSVMGLTEMSCCA